MARLCVLLKCSLVKSRFELSAGRAPGTRGFKPGVQGTVWVGHSSAPGVLSSPESDGVAA